MVPLAPGKDGKSSMLVGPAPDLLLQDWPEPGTSLPAASATFLAIAALPWIDKGLFKECTKSNLVNQ